MVINMTVKLRKVGNSRVLTVPQSIHVSGKEFDVFSGRNGSIVFMPKEDNPFKNPDTLKKYGEFDGDMTGFVDVAVEDSELEK